MYHISKKIVVAAVAGATGLVGSNSAHAGQHGKLPGSLSGGAPTSRAGAISSPLEVTYTFPSFSQVVFNEPAGGVDAEHVLLTGLPAGVYSSFSVTVDWNTSVGDAYSNEALWALTNNPDIENLSTIFYGDPGEASNAANNSAPRTLTWNGYMGTNYNTADGPLYFVMAQLFNNSGATWSNISITLGDAVAPPLTPPASLEATLGGSSSAPVAPGGITWYSFNYNGSGPLALDTAGSTLTPSSAIPPLANDTEMGLYRSDGTLVGSNDDANFSAGIYTSRLAFPAGELPADTYYLAVGGWNAVFGATGFAASSTSISSGTIVVNGLTVVPEPATLGVIVLAGTLTRRRR